MAIHNEVTLQNIYNCEVASNLVRKYFVPQDKTTTLANLVTLILTATALQNTLNTTSNWSNCP